MQGVEAEPHSWPWLVHLYDEVNKERVTSHNLKYPKSFFNNEIISDYVSECLILDSLLANQKNILIHI